MAYIAKITNQEGSTYDIRSKVTNGILYGVCDSTSTSTNFTAQIPGVTEYYDGLTIMLRNNVVTSASGFTININGLGAKGSYNNMTTGNTVTPTSPTRDTTIFNINYTMMFTYSSSIVSGGGWICYRGYDANTNTIGYQLRTNSSLMTVTDTARYYKMYFTSADGKQWVPASVNSTNNTTSARPVNQRPIDPFGRIVYTSASTNFTSGSNLTATAIWDVYAFSLGYSFNRTGEALTLTAKRPVYLKCAPQSNGSAIMDADTPIVQALPSTEDGKIYILLGNAYDATHLELCMVHPVYYYKSGAIRLWTNAPEVTVPTKISDLTNDSGFITGINSTDVTTALGYTPYNSTNPNNYVDATGAANAAPVQSVNGSTGAVTVTVPTKTSDLTNDSGFITGMEIMSYGSSTWAQFIAAYQAKKVVYCRASSNSNPASGSQTRLAFMAYVNNAENPTEVEFQYYRSVNTHSDSQQGDQVYVYKLTSNGSWTVTVREAMSKIAVGTGLSKSYANGTITISNSQTGLPAVTSSDNGKVLMVVNGAWAAETIPNAQGVSF